MMRKNDQGVTLVELLVGIAIGSLVTLAATTVILMGLRLNRQSMDVTDRQNTARVLITAMEKLAADGEISGFDADENGWTVFGKTEATPTEETESGARKQYNTIYSYVSADKAIYTGAGELFMEDVISSELKHRNGLLTISVETEEGVFDSSIYCRIPIAPSDSDGVEDDEQDEKVEVERPEDIDSDTMSDQEKAARIAFVSVLWSQYQTNPYNYGVICNYGDAENPTSNVGMFYSNWYIGSGWGSNGWDEFTPWCACYVSWAIAEVERYTNYKDDNYRPSFAGVDSFLSYFYVKKDGEGNQTHWITADGWLPEEERGKRTIYPGDVIFLDWVVDNVRNPQHVGVVLGTGTEKVNNEDVTYVYTIEGNVAASYTDTNGRYGTVGLRKYELSDPRILGYGVLDWQTGNT